MIYTDGAHLTADSLQELLHYAQKMRINWDWIHASGRNFHPHFDICGEVRKRVLADDSVKIVSKKEIVRLCQINYRVPENEQEVAAWENHHGKKFELAKPSESDFERMFENIKQHAGL